MRLTRIICLLAAFTMAVQMWAQTSREEIIRVSLIVSILFQNCKYKHLFDFSITSVAFCKRIKGFAELLLPEIRP